MEILRVDGLLNVREAAQTLGVSVSTLYGWVWQRRIPFVKLGRSLRFRPADLERFIAANRVEGRAQMPDRVPHWYNTRAAGKG
jgi:excisionase family DNA binding protein